MVNIPPPSRTTIWKHNDSVTLYPLTKPYHKQTPTQGVHNKQTNKHKEQNTIDRAQESSLVAGFSTRSEGSSGRWSRLPNPEPARGCARNSPPLTLLSSLRLPSPEPDDVRLILARFKLSASTTQGASDDDSYAAALKSRSLAARDFGLQRSLQAHLVWPSPA